MSHKLIVSKNDPSIADELDCVDSLEWAGSSPEKPEVEIYYLLNCEHKNNGVSGDGSEEVFTHEQFIEAYEKVTDRTDEEVKELIERSIEASRAQSLWVCFW